MSVCKSGCFRSRLGIAFIGLILFLSPRCFSQHEGSLEVEANPGRPTVSTPATLTPVGYLQFETGILGALDSGEFLNRTGFEEVLKLSLTHRIELICETEPFVYANMSFGIAHEPGEVFTGFQTLLHSGEGHNPAISASYFHRAYASPAPELDIGTNRQSALLLASVDLGRIHIDSNAIVTEQIEGRVHRAQFGQTFSMSYRWHKISLSGELWRFSQPFTGTNAIGILLAPSYIIRPNLVLDGGFDRGVTSTSTQWESFIGFTYLLPKKLW